MATLAAVLLLVAASNAAALAKAVEYHSFVATPLSPHAYTAPAADTDEDVFGGSLAVAEEGAAAAAASAVHFRVVHRDTFAVNATAAELLKHRLQRDKRRAARISKAAAAGGAAANGTRSGGGGVAAPVVSGLAQGSGEYFTKIGVGTPATPALMVLDTGSDVVWLQCAPCCRFYALSGRVFGQQDRCGTAPQQRRRCIALQQRRPASSHLARAASPSRTPAVATTSSPDLSLSTTTNSSTPSRSRCSFASTSSC